jgi:hypothetical protein
LKETQKPLWTERLQAFLHRLRRTPSDLVRECKSAPWKVVMATALKAATNRWLGIVHSLGELSRRVSAWHRQPNPVLQRN